MTEENPKNDKYDYLLKKDWDDLVVIDDEKLEARDFWSEQAVRLSDLTGDTKLKYNPSDYNETQTNPTIAKKHIKQLLNFPSKKDFVKQREFLQGEDWDNWIKFNKKLVEHVQTEVDIHQATSVIELGWEPSNEKRTTQLTKDKNLKGHYLLTVMRPDGTLLKDVSAATDWVEANFKKEVLAAAQQSFFQSLTKVEVISLDGQRK